MAKTEKNHSEENMEQPSCNCSKDCKCGCQEGKECTCGNNCGCGCGCGNGCCCKKKTFKLLAILIIFLAGMGFNELIHCCGRCPTKGPRPMPGYHQMVPPAQIAPMPKSPYDNNGGTVIIINADGSMQTPNFNAHHKNGCGCNKKGGEYGCKKHHKGHKQAFNDENIPSAQPQAAVVTE